jgi:hypothetical protein
VPAAPATGGLGELMSAKVAGVPAWAAVAAVVAGFFVVRKLGLFGGSASSTPAANPPNQGVPSGWVPASTIGVPGAPTTPSSATNTITVGNSQGNGVTVWSYNVNQQGSLGTVQDNTSLPVIGPAAGFHSGEPGYLVLWQGGVGWIAGSNVVGGSGVAGTGGRGGGSRSAVLMHHVHPLVKQRVRFPHYYVAGRGGPTTVQEVAQASGLHPARIMALNPHLRAQNYRMRPGQVARIA